VNDNSSNNYKEAKCIAKCRKCGVDTPTVYFVDAITNRLYLEFIDGITVKQYLYNNYSSTTKNEKGIIVISPIFNFVLFFKKITTQSALRRAWE
jgi:tRNA A-37 threonylcarbamoyl transferase component Bud32